MKTFIDKFHDEIGRRYRKHLWPIDRILVMFENLLLNAYAQKKSHVIIYNLEGCIKKGIKFFQDWNYLSIESIGSFTFLANEMLEPKLALLKIEKNFRKYCDNWKDPHLRLFDENYEPERDGFSCPNELNVNQLMPPEIPILQCLYADRLGLKEDFLSELVLIDDNGGYGTTHILLGCEILRTYSNISHKKIDSIADAMIKQMVKAQRVARICDLFSERTAFLLWMDSEISVQPAWIIRIIKGQMHNGSWFWDKNISSVQMVQHATSQALAALILYREKVIKKMENNKVSATVELGKIFNCSSQS